MHFHRDFQTSKISLGSYLKIKHFTHKKTEVRKVHVLFNPLQCNRSVTLCNIVLCEDNRTTRQLPFPCKSGLMGRVLNMTKSPEWNAPMLKL